MSDNKKYYYIKLKDNYFEQDNIKILEAQENGYIYSLIILKLYIKSAKYEGQLMMTDRIPYDPKKLDILSRVLNHDIAHVKDALTHAIELDLITIVNSNEIWMTEIQNFLGHSSSEADRIRSYRKKLDTNCKSVQMYNKSTPEIEIEIELKIEKEIEKDIKKKKPKKHKHGEYQHILLTDSEFNKLKTNLPDYEAWIKKMDEGIEMKGYKYKSHYLAILSWHRNETGKQKPERGIETFEAVKF